MKTYSIKKGLAKGFTALLIGLSVVISLSGFAEFTLWQLVETYLKPVLGSLTVGAAIGMLINFVKIKMAVDKE